MSDRDNTKLAEGRRILAMRLNFAPDGKTFRCSFIEPGLIAYHDHSKGGVELLRKQTIDGALESMLGAPVTIKHPAVGAKERISPQETHGKVTAAWYDSGTGWYWAEGTVDTEEAREALRRGGKPSCAYGVTEYGPGGTLHGMGYDRETTGIQFQHLAIVENPRFEEAEFRLNSYIQPMFKFIWKKIKEMRQNDATTPAQVEEEQSVEIPAEATAEVDGTSLRLNELVEGHKALKTTTAERDQLKAKADADAKELEALRTNAAAVRKELDDLKAKADADAKELEALRTNAANHFATLRNASQTVAEEGPKPPTDSMDDRLARGKAKY